MEFYLDKYNVLMCNVVERNVVLAKDQDAT